MSRPQLGNDADASTAPSDGRGNATKRKNARQHSFFMYVGRRTATSTSPIERCPGKTVLDTIELMSNSPEADKTTNIARGRSSKTTAATSQFRNRLHRRLI